MMFKELGRGDQWDGISRSGNPAASHQVRQWSTGYDHLSNDAGFMTTSAVAIQVQTVHQLLSYLLSKIDPNTASMQNAMAARDGFAFCLMWHTGMRSVNARMIRLEDFMLHGQPRGSLQAHLQVRTVLLNMKYMSSNGHTQNGHM